MQHLFMQSLRLMLTQLYFLVISFLIKSYIHSLPLQLTSPTLLPSPIPQPPKKVLATMAIRGKCILPWCQGFGLMMQSHNSLHKQISAIRLLRAFHV